MRLLAWAPIAGVAIAVIALSFATTKREGIHVSLGFVATVNVEVGASAIQENIVVTGASPVVDVQSTNVSTHFDTEKLASLPRKDQDDVIAFLFHFRHVDNTHHQAGPARKLQDEDPSHWLSPDDFEHRWTRRRAGR
mgnify:CR=1 FL=1